MEVRVRYFAQARDAVGRAEEILHVPEGATVGNLRQLLPPPVRAYGLAVNRTWSRDEVALRHGDEVAVLPPVSGGSPGTLP